MLLFSALHHPTRAVIYASSGPCFWVLTRLLTPCLTSSLTHSPTHPPTHSPTHPLTYSPTHPLTRVVTHAHSLTHVQTDGMLDPCGLRSTSRASRTKLSLDAEQPSIREQLIEAQELRCFFLFWFWTTSHAFISAMPPHMRRGACHMLSDRAILD